MGRARTKLLLGVQAVAAVLVTLSPAPCALPEDLAVERFGAERGFPSETITALYRDRAGFLWVGTREGLALYDGYTVRVFEHVVGDPESLADNTVRTLFEDREGRLWIGTNSGGLQRLDRATGRFETFRHDSANPSSLSHDSVYTLVQDRAGVLWVGTQDGLNRFDPGTGSFERLPSDPADPATLPHSYIHQLHLDREGRIWVGTVGGGVARVDPVSRQISRIPFDLSSRLPEDPFAFAIAEDRAGGLWFGGERSVYRMDTTAGFLRGVQVRELDPKRPPIITDLAFDANGVLWIATWNAGLVAYEPSSREARQHLHDPERSDSLSADRLTHILADPAGDLWIGTWGGGVNRFNSRSALFRAIRETRPGKPGLPYREVTAVLEDRRGGLWVGTWGRGLHRRGAGGRDFTEIGEPDPLVTVLSMVEAADGTIWAGSMSSLSRIDPVTGVGQVSARTPEEPGGLGPGYVNAVHVDRSGLLWVGTGGGGLYRLEPDEKTFTRFRHDPRVETSLSDDYVTTLRQGRDGTLWVGTRSGGLNALDPSNGRSIRFLPDPANPASIGHHHVTAILEDRQGTIWVGTVGGGLARIEHGGETPTRLTRITMAEGLVSENVVSMLEDDDQTLWIGTRHGLSRYDPTSGRFHNYGLADGLPGLEFYAGAAWPGRETMFFGTSRGILEVHRGTPFSEPPPSPMRITEIRTLAGPWRGSKPPWGETRVEVSYGTTLSFGFSVLDFRSTHRFAYRLAGKSDSWIDLGTGREITFAGLLPGEYALSVRGRNARGVWSETDAPLAIHVVPPFWMTWWFRVGLGLVAGGAVWTWHQTRTAALERRNRELETLQREREKALVEAHASQQELHGAYERLRALTRKLEDAREDERRRIARELHDEMGQALSAVKINLKTLGRLSGDPQVTDRLADALTLVDGMIGHVRELSLDLRPPLLDELGLVAALRGYAEGQAMRSDLDIVVEATADGGSVQPETAIAAFRIVQESIHNVLRHAAARRVTVSVRSDPERLLLSVRDDGRGFDVAAALDRAATGGHLGLLGMRERLEAMGGSFEIDSVPGRGTEIRARLPLESPKVPP